MAAIFAGHGCEDPITIARSCAEQTPPLPTDRWLGKAGSFRVPIGREVGRGWVLLRKSALDAIDLAADHALALSGADRNHVVTFPRITFLHAECVTPGSSQDANAVYLCEVVDRRHHLSRRPLDRAYNLDEPDGDGALVPRTTNAGTPWTWQTLVTDLATELGIAPLTLPFTPDGTPSGFAFWAPAWAWGALCDVLDRLACAVEYDAERDTFAIVRLGAADATSQAAQAALARDRLWDGYSAEAPRGWRPDAVRVVFRRLPLPDEGFPPTYYVDVPLAAAAGVQAGTTVQLADDLTAEGETGPPDNVADLVARAAERAADWLRKRQNYERRLLRVYRDFQPPGVLLGSTLGRVTHDDRGGPFATAIEAEPDGLLERWGSGPAREGDEEAGAPPSPTVPPPPPAVPPSALRAQQIGGAWIAGLTSSDCLKMETLRVSGKCSDVALQTLHLTSLDGHTWESTTDFISTGSSGSGVATFVRTAPVPEATLVGVAGWWLGVSGDSHVFAFDSSALCGGARVPCKDYIVVAFTCTDCPTPSGSYGPPASTLTLTIPGGSTRAIANRVLNTTNPMAALRLCLSVPCAGGLSNLTVLLTAPDGVTTYTIMSNPAGLTAQSGDIVFLPGAATAISAASQSSGAVYGVYAPDEDFSAYPAGLSGGVWTLTIVNRGACAASLSCFGQCFGTVSSGLSGFSVSATPSSGAAPLTTTLGATITGSPVWYSVDWGDGSPEAWYASPVGLTHTYSTPDSYEIVVRAYSGCGQYVEDSVIVTVAATVTVACAGSPVPENLNWEIYDITGDCSCISVTSGVVSYGTFSGFPAWGDIPFTCLLGECEENATYYLVCNGTDWEYSPSPGGGGGLAVTVTPSPFEVIFTKPSIFGPGSYKIRFYA